MLRLRGMPEGDVMGRVVAAVRGVGRRRHRRLRHRRRPEEVRRRRRRRGRVHRRDC